jgi:hypothetical protein
MKALSDPRTPVLALSTPPIVDLSTRETVPLLAVSASATDAPINVAGAGVIVAVRLEGNQVVANTWREWKERPKAPVTPPRPGVLAGFAVTPFRADLRKRLPELPWRPGHLVVRLIVGDRVTDPSRVELSGGAVADDPDVRTYVEWAQSQQGPSGLPLENPLPMDHHRDEWTPDVPAEPGIALTLQRVSLTREEDQLLLRGSYNLPLRAAELVPAGSPGSLDAQGRQIAARFNLTLVFVGHDSPGPSVVPLRIEARAFARDLVDGRPCAAGQFRCDLFGHPDMPRVLQRYSVYAFSGEYMTGPFALTLISESLVPLRDDET